MPEQRVQRRLAAILAGDVVGYSRLMEADEVGALARLKDLRRELIDPRIADGGGRIVKTTGDGVLIEFPSSVDAVRTAVDIQQAVSAHNQSVPQAERMEFRIGVHVGDVIVEDDDIYGDGVNVAARLEGLAEPGGVCISEDVQRQVAGKIAARFEDMGEQRLKNIERPVRVFRVASEDRRAQAAPSAVHQEVRFCSAADGVQIAYATVGEGPTLVKTANWLNHLEYDWESPVWRHLLHALARDHRLVRYDARGNGLSDWDVDDISFDAFVRDLETVVDAAGLDRFALFGVSQGCAVSVAYAVRNPERVTRLVLYGGFARGRRKRSEQGYAQSEAFLTLMRQGWIQDNPAFRQIFTSLFLPEGTPEQMQWFNDLQRITTSPENAVRIRTAVDEIDVTDLLPQVQTPTLVLHCRDESVQPFSEGRRMATLIPNARFVALEGRNHLVLESEPAFRRLLDEMKAFLAQ